MSHHDGRTGDSRDDWATPAEYIQAVEARYGPLTLDAACLEDTAQANSFYTPEDNALIQPWRGHCFWLNPPFDELKKGEWGEKAAAEAALPDTLGLMLTPVRTGSEWWRWLVFESGVCREVLFNYPRIKFLVGGVPMERPAFDTNLLVLRGDKDSVHDDKFKPWDWTQECQRNLFDAVPTPQ